MCYSKLIRYYYIDLWLTSMRLNLSCFFFQQIGMIPRVDFTSNHKHNPSPHHNSNNGNGMAAETPPRSLHSIENGYPTLPPEGVNRAAYQSIFERMRVPLEHRFLTGGPRRS